jgi:predicted dinucleotide-binding enzyme
MKIGILGTGIVGTTVGSALILKGHQVKLGSRGRQNEKAAEWVTKNGENASQTLSQTLQNLERLFLTALRVNIQ